MQQHTIKDVYLIHHSHTDVGYTDLQEQVIYNQAHNIKRAVQLISDGKKNSTPEKDLKWNCETWYCVEQFLKMASKDEKESFWNLVRTGSIGLSATYLNSNDLTDCRYLNKKIAEMKECCQNNGVSLETAMNADINGISLGARDAFIDNGIHFLYTNIHTHHGMYPLYQNQQPYFWENNAGERLLVWSGEHYNLGNALGIVYNKNRNFMTESYFGKKEVCTPLENLYTNLTNTVCEYEENGYAYPFLISSVSGVFSDNAPINPQIAYTIEEFNRCYGNEVKIHMATLTEIYELIRPYVQDIPVYRGAMNDWWGNGVGSTPHSVKHYKEAVRLSNICDRLEEKTGVHNEVLTKAYGDNSLLYSEHTWGHSASITNPYETMVTTLDIRNTSYASKAHEAAAMRKNEQCHLLGDILRYYNHSGKVKAVSTSREARIFPVEFYVETLSLPNVKVTDTATGEVMKVQLSTHPRGVLISFLAHFEPMEEKIFTYEEQPALSETLFTRTAWIGAERVRDIINTYDAESYTLPYGIENDFFKITWKIGEGITSFFDKKEQRELCMDGFAKFFTPVYERTEIRTDVYEERRLLGRNIRGLHAQQYQGRLNDVKVRTHGAVFTEVELIFELEGTYHSSMILKMYRHLPKLEFSFHVAKTLNEEIESLYLPLALNLPEAEVYIRNGGVTMKPGVDQLPGSNMEYYIADEGIVYRTDKHAILINTLDTPLLYMGELCAHPILLCDNEEKNNRRPVYSWIMNNTWETNFQLDLSGFYEFRYSLEMLDKDVLETDMNRLFDNDMGVVTFICE